MFWGKVLHGDVCGDGGGELGGYCVVGFCLEEVEGEGVRCVRLVFLVVDSDLDLMVYSGDTDLRRCGRTIGVQGRLLGVTQYNKSVAWVGTWM